MCSRRIFSISVFLIIIAFTSAIQIQFVWGAQVSGSQELILAIRDSQNDRIDALLKKGEGINSRDDYGWTPLMYAIFHRDPVLVQKLMSAGADANTVDHDGVTPLIEAIIQAPQPFMMEYLPDNGKGMESIPQILIENGADPNKADKEGNTPLMYALAGSKETLIAALIRKGADPNLTNKDGLTPLFFAEDPARASYWAPADGALNHLYRPKNIKSEESRFPPDYAAKVAEARTKGNAMLDEIRPRIVEMLKNAGGATSVPAQGVQESRLDSTARRLGTSNVIDKILMNYVQEQSRQRLMNRKELGSGLNIQYDLIVRVASDGTVTKALVLSGVPGGTSDRLREAALKTRYQPALKDGRPVEVWDRITGFIRSQGIQR